HLELCPWGWTDELREWGRRNGLNCPAPPQPSVRAVNSRRFSFSLEQELGYGLPGAARIESEAELTKALHDCLAVSDRWLIKAEFGMSARERTLSQGSQVPEQAHRWLSRRLQTGGAVFLEPWVERIEEVGLQFSVPATGPPQFLGATPLL